MRIKKKLATLLASTLLVTSINVMPAAASDTNQETGTESTNAVANTDLTLSVAALNENQGSISQNATGKTTLSLAVGDIAANQGNATKSATGSTTLTLVVEDLKDNQGSTYKDATGSTKLTLVIVNHNWTYTANANTIKAYCDSSDHECQYHGAEKAVTLTVTAADATYSGRAYSGASVTVAEGFPVSVTNSDIKYYLIAENGSEKALETAPTDAGNYKAKVIVGTGNNTAIAEQVFTIAKKAISPSVTLGNWQYGKAASTPTVSGNPGNGAVTYYYRQKTSTNDADWKENVPTDAGEYTVKAEVAATTNYASGSDTADFTIFKKAVTVTPDENQSKTYGEADPVLTYTVSGLIDADEEKTGVFTGALTRAAGEDVTEAGYEISVGTLDAKNYTITVTPGVKFMIRPRSLADAVITLNPGDQEYTGSVITQTIQSVKVGDTFLTLSDYVSDTGSVTSATDIGTYTVKINGTGNYTGSVSSTWKITKGQMTGLSETELSATYDGQPHSFKVSVDSPSDAAVTYSETESGTYTLSPFSYTKVGVYTVYYKIEKEGYESKNGTLTVTINPGASHDITMGPVVNGTIDVKAAGGSLTSAGYGSEVTLTATPDSGYRLKKWIVTTVEGTEVPVTDNKFTMPDNAITIKAEFEVISSGGGSGSSDAPSAPTTPVTPTEDYTIPVKNEHTVEVKAEIKDGTANVSEITADTIDKVANNKDAGSKVDTITIDLSGAKQEVTGVTLSKKSVETLAKTTAEKDNGIDTATIELSKATVVLDNKTLETLADQAKGSQIELVVADTQQKKLNTAQQTTLKDYHVATTFEAYFTSGGQRIHDFNGGTAAVSIKFAPEAGKSASYYHLVYVADNGELTRYKTRYENGRLLFTTTHFSDYAVIYDTSEKNDTEESADITLDTTYRTMRLRVPTSTKTTNALKWAKVADADGYVIYGAPCNTNTQTYTMEKQVTIKDGATTTWTDKKLTSGTYYKYYIKAYKLVDGKKVWLAKSKVVHSTTTGGKYGNAKSVKVNKTSVSLAVGKTFTIQAEQIAKDQPIQKHAAIKYESSNSKIASVTSKGVIKAKKKGTCYIYVYAQNGMYKRIKVTVK